MRPFKNLFKLCCSLKAGGNALNWQTQIYFWKRLIFVKSGSSYIR